MAHQELEVLGELIAFSGFLLICCGAALLFKKMRRPGIAFVASGLLLVAAGFLTASLWLFGLGTSAPHDKYEGLKGQTLPKR